MRVVLVFSILASLAVPAQASDEFDFSMKSKSVAASSASVPARNAQAPFRIARDPLPELMMLEEQERRGPSGACQNAATSVCYDVAEGKIVYRGARQYMPKIDGLRPESMSLRRGRLTLKYSF
jgi:hypothetical protein